MTIKHPEVAVEKETIRGKRRARRLIVQALYQWQMTGHEIYEIEAQFRVSNNMEKVDTDYFCRLLHGIPQNIQEIESNFKEYLDRPIEDLNPIELAVLRIGTFELLHCLEIPYKVVLDESVSLTKEYGSQDGYKYVNGVLNKLAQKARATEIKAEHE